MERERAKLVRAQSRFRFTLTGFLTELYLFYFVGCLLVGWFHLFISYYWYVFMRACVCVCVAYISVYVFALYVSNHRTQVDANKSEATAILSLA